MAKISIKKILYPPSLFLEMEAADIYGNIKDSSKNDYPSNTYGYPPPTLNTSIKKNGNSSLFFSGTSVNFIAVRPNSNDLRFDTQNFTLEFSCYFDSDVTPNNQQALLIANAYNRYDTGGVFIISITVDRKIQWFLKNTFTRTIDNILSINTWHEIALIRKDAELFLYINGIQMDSYSIGKDTSLNCTSNYLIGLGSEFYNENLYKGYLDDIKITKNFIKYPQIPPTKLNIKKVIEGSQVSSISGLSLWLKADAGVTMGGGNVSNWADQSSNGNNAIGPSQKRPTYVSNGLNGKPAMSFNGSTQLFTINDSNSLDITNCSIYIVLQRNGDGIGNEVTFMKNGNTNNDSGRYWQTAKLNGGNSNFEVYTNGFLDRDSSADLGDGIPKIMSFTFDGSILNIYSNGIKTASYAQNGDINSSTGTLQIGGYNASFSENGNNPGEYFNGYISEFIIFNRALNDDENLSVTNYLNSKYNIYSSSYVQNGKLRIKTLSPAFPIDGLFAFWNLNESSGTRYDSSPNGRNLTQTYGTVSSTTGKIANCAYFNGTSGGGSTNSKLGSTSFGVNPNSNFSMSVWMKPRSFSSYQHIIGAPFQNGFYIGANESNLTFNLYNGTVYGISAPSTAFDTWHHYVFIRDGNTLKLYADNVYIGSASIAGQSFYGNPVFSVGGGEYNEYYFNGDIDALGLWTRALTELEIASLYNGGNGFEI